MNIFATIVGLEDELKTPLVRYYTVALDEDGEQTNLLAAFILKHRGNEDISEEYNDLLAWIVERMGGMHGAKPKFFRFEGKADALPPPSHFLDVEYEHNLRLYCMRLSDHVVILFNGGVKTADKAQKCPVVAPHFHMAQKLCKAIQEAIKNKEIALMNEETELSIPEGFEMIL